MKPGCSCKKDPSVTIIPMGNQQVGIVGLRDLFGKWSSLEKTPQTLEDTEILTSLGERNYVSEKNEIEYVSAIRRAYSRYCENERRKAGPRGR